MMDPSRGPFMNLSSYDSAKDLTDQLIEKLTWRACALKTDLDRRALMDSMGQLALTIEAERKQRACLAPAHHTL